MAVFKVAVTDSVFPNRDTERAILAREGAEIAASQCRSIAASSPSMRAKAYCKLAFCWVWCS